MVSTWITALLLPTLTPADHYPLQTVANPLGLQLEVSGIAPLPDGRVALALRKGEIWIASGLGEGETLRYRRFASGLHEPLGLAWNGAHIYTVQRSELTRFHDRDGDGVAEQYECMAKGWGVSGNYHEYAYGPAFDHEGNAYLTLNASIGKKVKGYENESAWRGWSMMLPKGGKNLVPVSGGMRSPIGIGVNHLGDVFGTDHQGNWFPTCPLYHIKPGVFHGHADALKSCDLPGATFQVEGKIRQNMTVVEAAREIGPYTLPAVWFPYKKTAMGVTAIACDTSGGKFGPFENQLFVGEFTMSAIVRVALEKVKGEYQGAVFKFREGLASGPISLAFGPDGSLFVGESNRGWNSLGTKSFGLQRVSWSGDLPFEMQTMRAKPDGFELVFTQPVDPESARNPASYRMTSYTYPYRSAYGGEETNTQKVTVTSATLAEDGRTVRLRCEGLREGYVHELHAPGVLSRHQKPLLHKEAFYTLNRLP